MPHMRAVAVDAESDSVDDGVVTRIGVDRIFAPATCHSKRPSTAVSGACNIRGLEGLREAGGAVLVIGGGRAVSLNVKRSP